MLLAVIMLLTGIAAILLEFFVPAFGLIGVIGAASIIGSIITAFRFSATAGAVFLIASLITVPALMLTFFRIFPNTFYRQKNSSLHRNFDSDEGFKSSAGDYSDLDGKNRHGTHRSAAVGNNTG